MLAILTSGGIPAERHQQGLLANFKGGHGNPDISATLELSEFLAIFAGNKARQNRDKSMTAFGSNDE